MILSDNDIVILSSQIEDRIRTQLMDFGIGPASCFSVADEMTRTLRAVLLQKRTPPPRSPTPEAETAVKAPIHKK
jgi:hypothetical protein